MKRKAIAHKTFLPGKSKFWLLILMALTACASLSNRAPSAAKLPEPELIWFYLSFAGVVLMAIIVSVTMVRLAWVNQAMQREVAERQRVQAHLQTMERRYRILVENAPFPILILHLRQGTLLYLNTQAAHKFEIVRKFALGKSAREFFVDPDHWALLAAKLQAQGSVQGIEMRLKGAAGSTFWASLAASTMTFEKQPAIFLAVVDITERKALEVKLQELALTDPLTGLFNRRYFTQKGEEEFVRAQRYHVPFSVIMLDVDKFKAVNDTFGHDAGDQVLRELAVTLRQNARHVDTVSRLGGEEFGLILPNTSREQAIVAAERLRRAVEHQPIQLDHAWLKVTVSIGVASSCDQMCSLDDLLRNADTALYRAKENGRNQVVIG